MSYIPIFIIVHDQLETLKKSVASYEKYIKTPIKIIFHDVASTYKPMLEYLETKKADGYTVYRSEKNDHHTVFDSINDYKNKNNDFNYYVLTDPDIELDNSPGDILDVYTFLLNKYQTLSVGPALIIDDIPDYYPGKKMVIAHEPRFWVNPEYTNYKSKPVTFYKCNIDTTFQLCNINNIPKKYPHKSMRVSFPYAARHLDWYIDPNNLTPCQKFYQQNTTKISHWNNPNYLNSFTPKNSKVLIKRIRLLKKKRKNLNQNLQLLINNKNIEHKCKNLERKITNITKKIKTIKSTNKSLQ